jgi:serine/threonine protein phosphatase PrpC
VSHEEPWPLLDSGGATPPSAVDGRCPTCTYPVTAWASFCEGCGGPLLPTAPPPPLQPAGGSAVTRRLGAEAQARVCPQCGGTIDADGYCQTCGSKAPDPRDHSEAAPAEWLAGVCDRGVQHARNEDAQALWVSPGGDRAVLVVCDGVSSSAEADVASTAGAEQACRVLAERAVGSDEDIAEALVAAAAEANAAIAAATTGGGVSAGSATFAAAVVTTDAIHFASLGDSRVYWLPGPAAEEEPPGSSPGQAEPLLLTRDDSMAQEFIDQGMPRDEAEAMPKAHAITKWLGSDALDVIPRTGALRPAGEGWLLVCSDGLWNYASEPAALAGQLTVAAAADPSPLAIARALVAWANAQGGQDNVTVALARYPVRLGGPAEVAGEGEPIDG